MARRSPSDMPSFIEHLLYEETFDTRDTGLMSPSLPGSECSYRQSHSQVLGTGMEVGLQLRGACGAGSHGSGMSVSGVRELKREIPDD